MRPLESVVVTPTELPEVDPPLDDLVAPFAEVLDSLAQPILVRHQQYATFTVASNAPLTGFAAIIQVFRARLYQLRAQRHQERAVQDRVAVAVVDAYTGARATEALVEVTDAVLASLRSTRERLAAFETAGLAQRSDVLQVEVALREAEQSARTARRGVDLARRRLALVGGASTPCCGGTTAGGCATWARATEAASAATPPRAAPRPGPPGERGCSSATRCGRSKGVVDAIATEVERVLHRRGLLDDSVPAIRKAEETLTANPLLSGSRPVKSGSCCWTVRSPAIRPDGLM